MTPARRSVEEEEQCKSPIPNAGSSFDGARISIQLSDERTRKRVVTIRLLRKHVQEYRCSDRMHPAGGMRLLRVALSSKGTGKMIVDEYDVEAWYLIPVKEYEMNPSAQDGMSREQIFKSRHEACDFIARIGQHLQFPLRTVATSQLYFQIFFSKNSMKQYPPLDIALTSVLVACKAEETYKKIRQILAAAYLILNPSFKGNEVDIKIVEDHRKRAIQYEDKMLEAIGFNFSITHPYQALLKLGRHLRESEGTIRGAFEFMQKLYMTSLILHYPPHYLALAALIEARKEKSIKEELDWAKNHLVNKVDLAGRKLLCQEMRGIQISEHGSSSVLKYLTDLPKPSVKPGHVLVKNEYAGVNFIDIYQRTGHYKLPLPFIPGREAAGVVEEVGEGITDIKPGDSVALLAGSTYAEYTTVERRLVSKIPPELDRLTAAAGLLQGMTATYLTTDSYPVKAGDFIFLPAAAGGTGLMIGQLCVMLGATVIGTASSEEKARIARDHGIQHVVIYTKQNVVDEVMRITGGKGVNVAYDGVGKAMLDTTLAVLGRRGAFISFGSASGPIDNLNISQLTKNSISLMRPALMDYTRTQEELETITKFVFDKMMEGKLKPEIYKVYPLTEAAQAQDDLQSGKSVGKLILQI